MGWERRGMRCRRRDDGWMAVDVLVFNRGTSAASSTEDEAAKTADKLSRQTREVWAVMLSDDVEYCYAPYSSRSRKL